MMPNKIVFLYLYGLHQLYHSAMTAMELGSMSEDEVVCLSCNEEHTTVLNEIKTFFPNCRTKIIEVPQPFRYKYLNFKKKTYPSVNAMIKRAKKHLIDADLVVTTSHGTPKMLKKFGIEKPDVLYQYHGVGDRKYGFDPEFKRFDYMILPGEYHQNRLVEENIIKRENTSIVGWPKLDYVATLDVSSYFNNSNPTFLYTPHWTKDLTSYNRYAEFVLEYFKSHTEYNLIFAPHLLIKHWKTAYGYNIDYDHYQAENIIVDFGSDRSTNGAYLKAADIYIGDVSSMVFEFIAIKPRPCLYLNAQDVNWQGNSDYRFWDFGTVVENEAEFETKLKSIIGNHQHDQLQIERVAEYMDLNGDKSALKAAKAINEFVKKHHDI